MPTSADATVLMSADGYEQRCCELDALRNEARRELAERMREARRDGDFADNLTLQDLLEEQAQLARRIALLEAQLAVAEIVPPASDGRVGIGSVVGVRDGDGTAFEYELVGPLESDVRNGRISMRAPVGQALLGHRAGARVDVATPRGQRTFDIVWVRPRGAALKEAA